MKKINQPLDSMDTYIAAFPPEVQTLLQQLRQTIQKAAPSATEAISYQIPDTDFQAEWQFGAFRGVQKAYWVLPGCSGDGGFSG